MRRDRTNDARPEEFELSGGALCLDLANTVGDRPAFERERLHDYEDLLRWSRQAELLTDERQASLRREAELHPRRTGRVFDRAVALRESIYDLFSALARGEDPAEGDLDRINRELVGVLPNQRLVRRGETFEWTWEVPANALDEMLWPVVRSAADLLTCGEASAVRECASPACSWLFVDRSRSRRRKWCDMSVCGNRAKARRHYERHKRNRADDA